MCLKIFFVPTMTTTKASFCNYEFFTTILARKSKKFSFFPPALFVCEALKNMQKRRTGGAA